MITSPLWAGKRYAVLGLARSGTSAARALVASRAKVVGWDDNPASHQGLWEQLKSDRCELGTEPGFEEKNWLLARDLTGYEAIIVSPGVPLAQHPAAAKAARYNLPVIGDIELFAQARASLPPHRVVGVTGTNGKSTTAALIHHILVTAGVPARLGGNIGAPILGEEPLPAGGVYVLELSSFQLELTYTLDCDVAVLLNITPDHLDRHGTMAAYAAAKARLFAMQTADHTIVANPDDPLVWEIATRELSRRTQTEVCWDVLKKQAAWPSLQGPHNLQNASAASATAALLGVHVDRIDAAFATYPGLPHRMERVREVGGVAYVNDSKATNPTSTAPALAAFAHIHWIAGGLAKTDELDACLPHLSHVRAAYLIGEAAPLFARLLDGAVPVVMAGTLAHAVALAAAAAVPGDTVLLSPACASFDQFADYAARGTAFKSLVDALGGTDA